MIFQNEEIVVFFCSVAGKPSILYTLGCRLGFHWACLGSLTQRTNAGIEQGQLDLRADPKRWEGSNYKKLGPPNELDLS